MKRGGKMKEPEAIQEELWWRDNEIKEWLRVVGEKSISKALLLERGVEEELKARQEELWWRDNEIKEWLRLEGEKEHFKSLTIRERGEARSQKPDRRSYGGGTMRSRNG